MARRSIKYYAYARVGQTNVCLASGYDEDEVYWEAEEEAIERDIDAAIWIEAETETADEWYGIDRDEDR